MILFIFVKVALEYPEVANEEEVAEFVLPDVEVPHHFPPAPPQVLINLEVWFTRFSCNQCWSGLMSYLASTSSKSSP